MGRVREGRHALGTAGGLPWDGWFLSFQPPSLCFLRLPLAISSDSIPFVSEPVLDEHAVFKVEKLDDRRPDS